MTGVFQRQIHAELPAAAGGEGVYIIDSEGKRYLDASGAAAVSCLGHGDADVIRAIKDQADKLAFAHTGFFTTEVAEELAGVLVDGAPEGIASVYFVSGGSEAIEAALKMARQYFLEIGQPERRRFIGRRQSYHGNTLGALSVGGNEMRRRPFDPMLLETTHIAATVSSEISSAFHTSQVASARTASAAQFIPAFAGLERTGPPGSK